MAENSNVYTPILKNFIVDMGSGGGGGGATDPYWDNVSLLLPLEGNVGDTSTTDLSTNNTAVTFYGGAQISDGQSKFGSTSLYLNGTDSYIRADDALTGITKTDSFTIEVWHYPTAINSYTALIGLNSISNGSNVLTVETQYIRLNGAVLQGSNYGGLKLTANQWNHVAYSYNGTTGEHHVYTNGVLVFQRTTALTTDPQDCVLGIGAEFDAANGGTPGNYMTGYINDVRVTRGVARYYHTDITSGTLFAVESSDAGATGTGYNAVRAWMGCGPTPTPGFYGVNNVKYNTFDNRLYFTVKYNNSNELTQLSSLVLDGGFSVLSPAGLNYMDQGCSISLAIYLSPVIDINDVPDFYVDENNIIKIQQLSGVLPPTEPFPTQ
jgi:hypothetical protein